MTDLYVAGVPIALTCHMDPTVVDAYSDGVLMAYYDAKEGVIALNSEINLSRSRRALLHEVLHVADDAFRIGLSHDQVRAVAAALAATLEDPRNRRLTEFLLGGPSPCSPS